MPWFVFQDDPLEETIVDHLAGLSKKRKKPILHCGGNGGPYTEKMIKLIEKHNVPIGHVDYLDHFYSLEL